MLSGQRGETQHPHLSWHLHRQLDMLVEAICSDGRRSAEHHSFYFKSIKDLFAELTLFCLCFSPDVDDERGRKDNNQDSKDDSHDSCCVP
jgi:hypothetical protein